MDFRQLRHFIEVVDQGSYSRAAEIIPISQSALTRSIQKLEDSLGVVLLNRTTRGLSLSRPGMEFYARAKFILKEVERARAEMSDTPSYSETIRLGTAPLFAGNLIPTALDRYHESHPETEIQVQSRLFPQLIDGVQNGEFDFVFSNLPFSSLPDTVKSEPIFEVEIVYLASRNHPLTGSKALSIDRISEFPWAVVDEFHANALYDFILTQEGMTKSPLKIKSNSLTLLRQLVSHPPFITLLPRHIVRQELIEGSLVELDVDAPPLLRKAGLIYRQERTENNSAETLMAIMREICNTN